MHKVLVNRLGGLSLARKSVVGLTDRPDLASPGCVAQSVGHLTRKSGVLGSIPGLATYFRFSFRFFKKGSCQLLAKYVHEVLVNRLSLPRKSVVRLTDRPDMTLDVYRGRKTTMQQQQPTWPRMFTVDVNQQNNTKKKNNNYSGRMWW